MAIQLTQEQEQRLTSVVRSGAYASVEEALEAALAGFEETENLQFERSQAELDRLLTEGMESGGSVEANEEFWRGMIAKTDQMIPRASGAKVGSLKMNLSRRAEPILACGGVCGNPRLLSGQCQCPGCGATDPRQPERPANPCGRSQIPSQQLTATPAPPCA